MIPAAALPSFMKAAQGKGYGEIDEMISVETEVALPSLCDVPASQRKTKMLIKVLTVALAPGDCRVLSGRTRKFQGPPSFPYVPAGDCCGTVLELPEEATEADLPFTVGDRVAVRFNGQNYGALGEYAVVSTEVTEKVPPGMGSAEAAALASASPATLIADRVNHGERVLVLGAGGGLGSHLCQLLRKRGASLVVGSSRSPERLLQPPLSYDKAIDYTKEDVFTMDEYIETPFDVIIDFATGHWPRIVEDINQGKKVIVKSHANGGRYITTNPDQPTYDIPSVWKMMEIFLFPALWRAAISRTWSRSTLPGYTYAFALPSDREVMTRTMNLAQEGTLKAVLHSGKCFAFTTHDVRAAFHVMESRHTEGKVVIKVADQ